MERDGGIIPLVSSVCLLVVLSAILGLGPFNKIWSPKVYKFYESLSFMALQAGEAGLFPPSEMALAKN